MRLDLLVWKLFLSNLMAFARPFIDFAHAIEASQITFFTDASGNPKLGMGGICNKLWMYQQWDEQIHKQLNPSIEFLELYDLTAAVLTWIRRFQNRRIILFCDNISAVEMINKLTSSCPNYMALIRLVILESLIHNVRVFAKYVLSKDNFLADMLSRLKLNLFHQVTANKNMDQSPTPIPEDLVPITKVWMK